MAVVCFTEAPDSPESEAQFCPPGLSARFVAPLAFARVNGAALEDALSRAAAARAVVAVTSPRAAAAVADAIAALLARSCPLPVAPLPCFTSGPRTAAALRPHDGSFLAVWVPDQGASGAAALAAQVIAYRRGLEGCGSIDRSAANSGASGAYGGRCATCRGGSGGGIEGYCAGGGLRGGVLFPCGDRSLDVLPATLAAAGFDCEELVVYSSAPVAPQLLRAAWDEAARSAARVEAVVFFSPSGVDAVLASCCRGLEGLVGRPEAASVAPRVIVIGSTTAAAAAAHGLRVAAVAPQPSADGVRVALEKALAENE